MVTDDSLSPVIPDNSTFLDIIAQNVQSVVYEVCSLLRRASVRIEGMICVRISDKTKLRMWLVVSGDGFEQLTRDLQRLEHVEFAECNEKVLSTVLLLFRKRQRQC